MVPLLLTQKLPKIKKSSIIIRFKFLKNTSLSTSTPNTQPLP